MNPASLIEPDKRDDSNGVTTAIDCSEWQIPTLLAQIDRPNGQNRLHFRKSSRVLAKDDWLYLVKRVKRLTYIICRSAFEDTVANDRRRRLGTLENHFTELADEIASEKL